MKDTQHTPGAWTPASVPLSKCLHPTIAINAILDGRDNGTVATLSGPGVYANARLIAAAPELLDMLRQVRSFMSSGTPSADESELLDEIVAAIAKATGNP